MLTRQVAKPPRHWSHAGHMFQVCSEALRGKEGVFVFLQGILSPSSYPLESLHHATFSYSLWFHRGREGGYRTLSKILSARTRSEGDVVGDSNTSVLNRGRNRDCEDSMLSMQSNPETCNEVMLGTEAVFHHQGCTEEDVDTTKPQVWRAEISSLHQGPG